MKTKQKPREFVSPETGESITDEFMQLFRHRYWFDILDDGKTIVVEWEDGRTDTFHEM